MVNYRNLALARKSAGGREEERALAQPHSATASSASTADTGTNTFGGTASTLTVEEEEEEEPEEAEEHAITEADGEPSYPPNLNLRGFQEVTPGVMAMVSMEDHIEKMTGLLLRRERHIKEWRGQPLRTVNGKTVLPPLEAFHKTNLPVQPAI
jgi:hypothetical protein